MTGMVSIIVPTFKRPTLLAECLRNIFSQDYKNFEVLVVSDGPDPGVEFAVRTFRAGRPWRLDNQQQIRVYELGFHATGLIPDSFGVGPLMVGALMAKGDYHMWLCDDERMTVDHVTTLVDLLEETGVDVVAPTVLMYRADDPKSLGWTIGMDPPVFGQFTSCLYRREALAKAMYRFHIENPPYPPVHDWDIMQRWIAAGATYRLSPHVTLRHPANH